MNGLTVFITFQLQRRKSMASQYDISSRFQRLNFNENPNVGVFCRANDSIAFLKKGLTKKVKKRIRAALDVDLLELTIADATIIGSLLTCNSSGVVVTGIISEENTERIRDLGFNVCVVNEVYNAAGNDILLNDNGCLVHPQLDDYSVNLIEKTCGVPVQKGTIAGLETVGMAAVVTSKGLLCHPKVTDAEKKVLETLFQVPVMIGTVNHGVPLIGSGLVANKHGAIMGLPTTGIEMGRIEEALQLIEKE